MSKKEITKNQRCYFLDTKIRNALIQNLNPVAIGNNRGELWENYIMTERFKKREYLRHATNPYFWRTYDRKEIELVEEQGGKLFGYEIKWKNIPVKPPKEWHENYPDAHYQVIHRENYLTFIQ